MGLTGLLRRVIVGSGSRPTRCHDERGNRVPLAGLVYAPHSFITTGLRACFGYHPPVPWLSYRGRQRIARILRPDSVVLELGSGMSTLWLAKRCAKLYSFEHNETWYRIVQARLSTNTMPHAHYELRDHANYADVSIFPDHSFDFILIDGIERPACVRNALPKLKLGGWIYLDNTDRLAQLVPESQFQKAEHLLLDMLHNCEHTVQYFTDFVPGNFVAKQGMLVQLIGTDSHRVSTPD